jgi:hypothetical protein
MVSKELEGLFVKLKNVGIWTFVAGIMVIKEILFI